MITLLTAATMLGTIPEPIVDPVSYYQYINSETPDEWMVVYCHRLTDEQRQNIWIRIHFAIKKMYYWLEEAEKEAGQITDVDMRELMVAAVKGAIAGTSTRNPYAVAISAGLAVIAEQADCSLRHWLNARDCLREAEYYADVADDLQEKLLRGSQ